MSVETLLPVYCDVLPSERGETVGLDFDTYRMLARTSLSITHSLPGQATMGIYRQGEVVCLDIWSESVGCLTIQIVDQVKRLRLLLAGLDSPAEPACVFAGANSPDDWRRLKDCALSQ